MRNIIYLNNYMDEKIIKLRNNKGVYSQAGNNKMIGITESIISTGSNLTIISTGLVNNKSFKIYKKIHSKYNKVKVIYCKIIDIPLINTLSAIYYMYKEIKRINKEEKIDNIIFYNYKPEIAWSAYLAKKRLKIPITVEYEDGYSNMNGFSKFKLFIFRNTEKIVSKSVDSAILVNSILKKKYNVPTVVIRGVVNKEFYEECKKYNKKHNDVFTILYSGSLDKERGINVLINALKYIPYNLKLIITGKGEISFNDNRIDFKGFVTYDEMKKMMMQADLLVQCQLVNNVFSPLSFPSKIFEYIVTNNYVVSSKTADITDFLKDELIYYENDSSEDLAEKIKYAYNLWEKDIKTENKLNNICIENLPEMIGEKIIEILK